MLTFVRNQIIFMLSKGFVNIKTVLSLVYMHNLHPGANLLPGAKLQPGINLHPLMQRSYVNKLCSYVIKFAL